ncbi:MAG: hypothetical protein A3C92_03775 [Candidatus Sungbacteria bacterium RIFCSPHIGHO2_02_FULL_53_17]|uniref:phosphoribosylamine--glycine ligase n=1 Tax=Candidatus Sungbacteria bacterium RIFCSPHIGHO2_02_FULL_53_17 TaxID=1802275 RepID=A0A1G2L045_9BACT|nr:MAG: hypothetical protein A3C92_03775 [Candidatus Sungbacteria bacterium RIFCSPHIGHO2_02_FULL_53_17]
MDRKLKVMVVGGGGRGHAVSEKHEESEHVGSIIVAGGDDFTSYERKKEVISIPCGMRDHVAICNIAEAYRPDFIEFTQDDAVAGGAGDMLREQGFLVLCPSRKASRFEWDKAWARRFMARHHIPAPDFSVFTAQRRAERYLHGLYADEPDAVVFVKAAGLAAGKGSLKAASSKQTMQRIRQVRALGPAGKVFLIERALFGREFSGTIIADGTGEYRVFAYSTDHKRALPFDEGEQTGGTGATSPVPMIASAIATQIDAYLFGNAMDGFSDEGIPYAGALCFNGILVKDDESPTGYMPHCIEGNARHDDPESQVVLPGVQNDYTEMVIAAAIGKLCDITLQHDGLYRVGVVGVSRGYPGDYRAVIGKRVFGLEEVRKEFRGRVRIYGGGLARQDKHWYANGGRLFTVVAEDKDPWRAFETVYAAMARLYIEGNNLFWRHDIGWQDKEFLLARG